MEITVAYCGNYTKHINTLWVKCKAFLKPTILAHIFTTLLSKAEALYEGKARIEQKLIFLNI
jgi:hypothetical protein